MWHLGSTVGPNINGLKTGWKTSADIVVQRLVGDGFGGSSVAHLGVLVLADRRRSGLVPADEAALGASGFTVVW